jgi:hypothetical protein
MKEPLIEAIIALEWEMFQEVNNQGGRASCQEDASTFEVMRKAQAATRSKEMLTLYLQDLRRARAFGINQMTEKYARMMESTSPEDYQALKEALPGLSKEKKNVIKRIMELEKAFQADFSQTYPHLASHGRPATKESEPPGVASIETYLESELATYSEGTLECYLNDIETMRSLGINRAELEVYEMMRHYGFSNLQEAEAYSQRKRG